MLVALEKRTISDNIPNVDCIRVLCRGNPLKLLCQKPCVMGEEEEVAVFIRGVNTDEDSPNAQHGGVVGGGCLLYS